MAQYIDKDVLVAEIERLACPEHGSLCDKLLEFLDSLEVKEVGKEPVSEDLEEAAMKYAKLKHKDDVLQKIVSLDFKAGAQWQKE